eukprot:545284-Ditylum_brightwellii.AAC.1
MGSDQRQGKGHSCLHKISSKKYPLLENATVSSIQTSQGLHRLAMMETIKNNSNSMMLEHYLNKVNLTIELIQEASRTDEEGQQLLICSKTNAPRVI